MRKKINEAWYTLHSMAATKFYDQFDAFGKYIVERLRKLDSNSCARVTKKKYE